MISSMIRRAALYALGICLVLWGTSHYASTLLAPGAPTPSPLASGSPVQPTSPAPAVRRPTTRVRSSPGLRMPGKPPGISLPPRRGAAPLEAPETAEGTGNPETPEARGAPGSPGNGSHPGLELEEAPLECPVLPWEQANRGIFLEVDGKRTYFCCDRCRRDWIRASAGTPPTPKGSTLELLARLHPLSVHFPIAFLCLAALAELLSLLLGSGFFREGARFNLVFAGLSAPLAAALGWLAGSGLVFPEDLADLAVWHLRLGLATAGVSVLAAALSESCPDRDRPGRVRAYRLLLTLALALVLATGYLGGQLVYGPDHLSL